MKTINIKNLCTGENIKVFFDDVFSVFSHSENIQNAYAQLFLSYLPFIDEIFFTWYENTSIQYIEFTINENNIVLRDKKIIGLIFTLFTNDVIPF